MVARLDCTISFPHLGKSDCCLVIDKPILCLTRRRPRGETKGSQNPDPSFSQTYPSILQKLDAPPQNGLHRSSLSLIPIPYYLYYFLHIYIYSFSAMEIQCFCHSADDLKGIMRCLVESLMVETALLAHKSLLLLLLQVLRYSMPNHLSLILAL